MRWLFFISGVLAGILLVFTAGILFALHAPSLLIVDESVHKADIILVLGGGGGSRFRKGLSLHAAGLADHLLLVDKTKNAWGHILPRFCPNCVDKGKVTVLVGSKNTFTDAELVEQYCREHGIHSILLVTDPYHTRRAAMIFAARFEKSGVRITVISSGNFAGHLAPDERWWQDNATLKTVWTEMNKILIILLRKYEPCIK
ncbi:MAG: YdcF family protein [Candidatus Electrothrix sp. AR4]|nr:YdcF family protein [Candidatus Electrothrix sp. AR4]